MSIGLTCISTDIQKGRCEGAEWFWDGLEGSDGSLDGLLFPQVEKSQSKS